jgi:hypothetical protein
MQDTLARTNHERYSLVTHQSLASLPSGGGRMSRRRSTNPTKAISITLPQSLLDNIDDQLTRTSSRSLWIATACKMRLDEDDTLGIETRQLLAMLHARATADGDQSLATLLLDRLTS